MKKSMDKIFGKNRWFQTKPACLFGECGSTVVNLQYDGMFADGEDKKTPTAHHDWRRTIYVGRHYGNGYSVRYRRRSTNNNCGNKNAS